MINSTNWQSNKVTFDYKKRSNQAVDSKMHSSFYVEKPGQQRVDKKSATLKDYDLVTQQDDESKFAT